MKNFSLIPLFWNNHFSFLCSLPDNNVIQNDIYFYKNKTNTCTLPQFVIFFCLITYPGYHSLSHYLHLFCASLHYMDAAKCSQSPSGGHLVCFQFFLISDNDAMNIFESALFTHIRISYQWPCWVFRWLKFVFKFDG